MDSAIIKDLALGKWFGVLRQLGIEVNEAGNHTGCPICGNGNNAHRFRMDKDGTGWICSQCGAGDTLSLIQKVRGLDFVETIKAVSDILGVVDSDKIFQPKTVDPSIALKKLWIDSYPVNGVDVASRYLKSRGIRCLPDNIRWTLNCYNHEMRQKIPAMLSVFTNKNNKPITLHRTYLNGEKTPTMASLEAQKKIMTPTEQMAGGAVRLFKEDRVLGVAEGIETALSCFELFRIPTWAALSNVLLESVIIPDCVDCVVVFGDNDSNYAGQKSAYILANKLAVKKRFVEVWFPEKNDFNDDLRGQS